MAAACLSLSDCSRSARHPRAQAACSRTLPFASSNNFHLPSGSFVPSQTFNQPKRFACSPHVLWNVKFQSSTGIPLKHPSAEWSQPIRRLRVPAIHRRGAGPGFGLRVLGHAGGDGDEGQERRGKNRCTPRSSYKGTDKVRRPHTGKQANELTNKETKKQDNTKDGDTDRDRNRQLQPETDRWIDRQRRTGGERQKDREPEVVPGGPAQRAGMRLGWGLEHIWCACVCAWLLVC